jgi:hypothetical protein
MPGVPRELIEHALNVDPKAKGSFELSDLCWNYALEAIIKMLLL